MMDIEEEQQIQLQRLKINFIPSHEIHLEDYTLGSGNYGLVKKARWKETFVALKYLKFDEFLNEAEQLSKIDHENIVTFYGYTNFCKDYSLIMEYADGGNLYSVLHEKGYESTHYTLSHAVSWCLQCARGVNYLHSIQPKPIIHRDLKPLNLLLKDFGRILKICDFGTARVKETIMSNNKGTPLWMAPEVFSSNKYTEKCDVFSFGIILWEVLTRRIPYEGVREPVAVLWAICNNKRPPMIRKCPKILRDLMQNSWNPKASDRPSMSEVVNIMEMVFSHCSSHANDPIDLSSPKIIDDRRSISNIFTNSTFTNNILDNRNYPTYSNRRTSDDCSVRSTILNEKTNLGHKRSKSSGEAVQDTKDEMIENLIQSFNAYLVLDRKYCPVQPNIHNVESLNIFEEHRRETIKLFRLQLERILLTNHLKELKKQNNSLLRKDDRQLYIDLSKERDEYKVLRENFVKMIMDHRASNSMPSLNQPGEEDWVLVDSAANQNQ